MPWRHSEYGPFGSCIILHHKWYSMMQYYAASKRTIFWMRSWHGSVVCITGPSWGEATGQFLSQTISNVHLWCVLLKYFNKLLSKQPRCWFETPNADVTSPLYYPSHTTHRDSILTICAFDGAVCRYLANSYWACCSDNLTHCICLLERVGITFWLFLR